MTIEEIKRISLLDFMFSIGYSKIKSSGNKYWFLSPLHKETKASFKVDVNTNLWYDFGLNKGGNIINLVQLLNPELSMHHILEKLSHGNYTISNEVATVKISKAPNPVEETNIDSLSDLTNVNLLQYVYSRNINMLVAKNYCKEVHYTIGNGKKYYGLAFINMRGGIEVRNKYSKRCIGGKDVSLILRNMYRQTQVCCVFEGFFDFLAFETARLNADYNLCLKYPCDSIVLNSVANVNKAFEILSDYDYIFCYLDNDDAGRNATHAIRINLKKNVYDWSDRYKEYNDVNDYLMRRKKPL